MKIAIDVSQVVYGTGVSVYTKELVKNLLQVDEKNEYVLFGGSLRRSGELRRFFHTLQASGSATGLEGESPARRGRSFKARLFPIPPTLADLLWNRMHFPKIETLVGKVDVFHSSDWTQPPSDAYKVTTVHDLVPFKYPEISDPNIVKVHKRRMKWVKNEVNTIIAPSIATKNDLIALGFNESVVRVISESVGSKFTKSTQDKIKQVKDKFGLEKQYLLGVGINPRKNTKRIVEAYKILRKELDLNLVLVGHPIGLETRNWSGVSALGHVIQEDLIALYSGAKALIYPSIYEGFGVPVLEAFACECPVVTSNVSSMPEVAGQAAVLVDPESVDSILNGINKVLNYREKYIKLGNERLKVFSWKKTAEQTLQVYKEANKL